VFGSWFKMVVFHLFKRVHHVEGIVNRLTAVGKEEFRVREPTPVKNTSNKTK
jgi:hypothetical protein